MKNTVCMSFLYQIIMTNIQGFGEHTVREDQIQDQIKYYYDHSKNAQNSIAWLFKVAVIV